MLSRLRTPLLCLARSITTCPVYIAPKAPSLSQLQEKALLQFPWFNSEQVQPYYKDKPMPPLPEKGIWTDFVKESNVYTAPGVLDSEKGLLINRECIEDFNVLYRELHQWVSIPDYEGIDYLCEKRFAKYLKKAVRKIHLAGLALDMERLTVRQPRMDILEFNVYKGLSLDRDLNGSKDNYIIGKDSVYGLTQRCTVYKAKDVSLREGIGMIEGNHKPYLIQAKMLIQSHMRLFAYTKNEMQWKTPNSPLGDEMTANIVQFEINVKGSEFLKFFPTKGKSPLMREWRITDLNNAMGGNPLLKE